MGTGIFFLPAVGADISGPASLIAWLIMGLISIYIAMCFGELTSMFPKAGGIYEFSKQAYGRFFAFMIGWSALITSTITIAMLVVGAVQYLLPYNFPLLTIPISLLFVFIFNYIAYRGMKTSSVMLVAFAFITLGTLVSLIVPGLFTFHPEYFSPFFVVPISGVLITIFFIAETFFGWETTTFLAEETKNGAKVMPKALITASIFIACLSLLFVFTSLGSIHWEQFGPLTAPLADLSVMYYGDGASIIFTLLVYLAIIGSVAGWIVASPRLILAMARDKLFIKHFAKIHPKYNTPSKAILLQTVLTSVIVVAGAGSYITLLTLLVPLVLLIYAAVIFSLIVLRIKRPDIKRPYQAPHGVLGSALVVLFLLGLIVVWIIKTESAVEVFMLGLSLVLVGLPVFLLLQMYYSPIAIRQFKNFFAFLALIFEDIFLPVKVRQKIFMLLGDVKKKKVFEFGCNVGTLTLHIAQEVGSKGKVYATDISERGLGYVEKRMKRYGRKNVKALLDPQHMERVHPSIPHVDSIVSVGTLAYVKDVHHVLTDMNKRLDRNSKICFLEYNNFFGIIPNKPWIRKDDIIKRRFKLAGFKVEVERKKGLLWTYVFIYGKKVKNVK